MLVYFISSLLIGPNSVPSKLYNVIIDGEKGGVISNVKIKVDDSYTFELHIDTDDANAHLVKNGDILKIQN